jgi:exonuclease VII small subunit
MDFLTFLAAAADHLDPAIGTLLAHFRDKRVPIELSAGIVAAALLLLAAAIVFGAVATGRVRHLRSLLRSCGTATDFEENFTRADQAMSQSILADSWREYRNCLKHTDAGVLYLRRPDEFFGLHAIDAKAFPARFFAASHGYFIGVGLVLTFVGLVAALKFAAAGVASPDLAIAKDALNALLAAAAFKFMTSIAGLGSALILSIAVRSTTCMVESAARGLAHDLERAMAPIFTESVVYDQLSVARAQLARLDRIEGELSALSSRDAAMPHSGSEKTAAGTETQHAGALQAMLAGFLAELRGTTGREINQLAVKLSTVGSAIGTMHSHVGQSGQHFAEQIDRAAERLVLAATKLREGVDAHAERAGARLDARIDSLAAAFSRGEKLLSGATDNAASAVLNSAGALETSMRAQIDSLRDIVASLERARAALDGSAASWNECTKPVMASVDASRQITAELGQVAGRIGAAQHDMAETARAVAQLSERIGTVWDNYRGRFEKVDGELEAVFERLQGGTRAFGEEVMDFVGKLDISLANGMQAFALGAEELREIAQMFVINGERKAA